MNILCAFVIGASLATITADAAVNVPSQIRRNSNEGEVVYQLCKALTACCVTFEAAARVLIDYLRSIDYEKAVRFARILLRRGFLKRNHYNEIKGYHAYCYKCGCKKGCNCNCHMKARKDKYGNTYYI